MTFESNTYFVADSGRDNNTGQDIFSLYVHRGDNTTQELIEGVEDMQVQFGEDQTGDGSVDRYVNASAPPDFTKVISVRVGLLLTSGDTATTQPDTATYDVLDETVDPADDRLLRKVFTVTATARNRELRSTAFN
jgi:type IV pilus assembly protein PilW